MKKPQRSRQVRASDGTPPSLQIHLRLYEALDRPLILQIKRLAEINERSYQQQVRFMLRKAAEMK